MRVARILLAWLVCLVAACDDSSATDEQGLTYGAEIHVSIVGNGSVYADAGGIECPVRSCFAALVVKRSEKTVKLRAVPAAGARFEGWTFDTGLLIGARSTGRDICSPMVRPTASAPVDPNATEIELPYGQVLGTPPSGRERACADDRIVPLAYALTAKFSELPRDDAELLYAPIPGGVGAHALSVTLQSTLFWTYDIPIASLTGIASGFTQPDELPASGGTLVTSIGTRLLATTPNVVYQDDVHPTALVVVRPTGERITYRDVGRCKAAASNESEVLCRTDDGRLLRVSIGAPTLDPLVLQTAVASGEGLELDGSTLLFADATSIRRTESFNPSSPIDLVVAGLVNPSSLVLALSEQLYYLDHDANGAAIGMRVFPQGSVHKPQVMMPATMGVKQVVPDLADPEEAWYAIPGDAGRIMRARADEGWTQCGGTIDGLDSIAVDAEYLYWTLRSGGIYRRKIASCK